MPLAGVNGANRFKYFLSYHALHHVAFSARNQSAFDIHIAFKGCENDSTGRGRECEDVADQFEPGGIAETKVDKHHIWAKFTKHSERFCTRFGRTYNFHIRL